MSKMYLFKSINSNLLMEVTMVKKVCCFLMVSMLLVSAAKAVELSYEGFDGYVDASGLTDQIVLGTGYVEEANWKNLGSNDATVSATGMTYPGLPVTGGSIETDNSGMYSNLDLSLDGPFAGLVGVEGEGDDAVHLIGGNDIECQVYLSFLVSGDYDNGWGGLTLYDPSEVALFGRTWQNTYYSTTLNVDSPIGNPGTLFDYKTHLIIIKIKFNSGTSDEFKVWIDPDLSKNEAGQNQSKMTSGTKNDLSFNFVVLRGQGVWHYDELRLGKAWRDVVGDTKSAINVQPADGSSDISIDTTFSWTGGEYAVPVEYKLYMSDSTDQLTEGDYVDTVTEPGYTPSASLAKDSTYYWRVDSVIVENDEPNTITGAVWSFDTEKSFPVYNSISQLVFGAVGETVAIEVNAVDPLGVGLSYAWYVGISGDTSSPVGIDSPELLVEITDESIFENSYWCQISNETGSVNSEAAAITEKVLLAHLPLESDTDPNNVVPHAPSVYYYLNPSNSYGSITLETGVVGNAIRFYQSALIFDPEEAGYFDPMNDYCTVSCWIKTERIDDWRAVISRHGESNGWQLREVWYSKTLGFTTRNGGDNVDGSVSGVIISDNDWHYVAATFNRSTGTKSVYIDGVKRVTDMTGGLPILESPAPVVLAARSTNDGPSSFSLYEYSDNMILDEVKLYNYPMTDAEVAEAYAEVVGSFCVTDIPADINKDCKVDLNDFSSLASDWLSCSAYPDCISFD